MRRGPGWTIAFVDLAGFTALTEAHGDDEAVALVERFEALVRAALDGGGQLVKSLGDAVMLAFEGPAPALATTARLFEACLAEPGFPVPRAGMHHGLVVRRGDDYFGATVNLAARVAAQAAGSQVLATAAVAGVARDEGRGVVELGAFALRHIADPVALFDIEVCAPRADVGIDPVCRMQVVWSQAAGRLRHLDVDHWFCSLACAAAFAAAPERYG